MQKKRSPEQKAIDRLKVINNEWILVQNVGQVINTHLIYLRLKNRGYIKRK